MSGISIKIIRKHIKDFPVWKGGNKKEISQGERDLEFKNTRAYVAKSVVAANKQGRRCIDGRYLPDQGRGMLARPGGDCGYVMALEAVSRKEKLNLSPEECFNAVYKAIKKISSKFYLHTDHACDPDNHTHRGLIGCGHLAKAGRRFLSWEYDVRSVDVRKMVQYARNLCEIDNGVEMVNLVGKHQEKGVLLIHNSSYTVLADNPVLNRMYFVYDIDRDNAFMKKLVSEMNIPGVTYENMKRESDLQINATLQNLAVGLPIYSVTFKGNKPKVEYVQSVEQKPLISRMHLPLNPFAFSFSRG